MADEPGGWWPIAAACTPGVPGACAMGAERLGAAGGLRLLRALAAGGAGAAWAAEEANWGLG